MIWRRGLAFVWCLWWVLVGYGLVRLHGQMPRPSLQAIPTAKVIYLPPDGRTPEVLLLRLDAPGTMQVCAERANLPVVCRSVEETRRWLAESHK